MREILFRGKTLESGRWIYGDLRHWPSGSVGICERETNRTIKVDPETVGQYAGLDDKNGTKVFEGDLLLYRRKYFDNEWLVVGYVVSSFGSAKVKDCVVGQYWTAFDDCEFGEDPRFYEVDGNIHDNPELIEGK